MADIQTKMAKHPVEIRQCDYRAILDECGAGDLVYLDPPYDDHLSTWLCPREKFYLDEMMRLAKGAIDRGAVVFFSHYGDASIDLSVWKPVHSLVDIASTWKPGTGQGAVRKLEHLFVAGKLPLMSADDSAVDARGNVILKRAQQYPARCDVFGRLGREHLSPVSRSDTHPTRTYKVRTLDLAHLPGHEWVKTLTSSALNTVLIPPELHRILDDETDLDVQIINRRWAISGHARDEWGHLDGRHIHQYRTGGTA